MSDVYRLTVQLTKEAQEALQEIQELLGNEPTIEILEQASRVVVLQDLLYPAFPDPNQWSVHLPLDIEKDQLPENLVSLFSRLDFPAEISFKAKSFSKKGNILSLNLEVVDDYGVVLSKIKKELIHKAGFRYLKFSEIHSRIILAKLIDHSNESTGIESLLKAPTEAILRAEGFSLSHWSEGQCKFLNFEGKSSD